MTSARFVISLVSDGNLLTQNSLCEQHSSEARVIGGNLEKKLKEWTPLLLALKRLLLHVHALMAFQRGKLYDEQGETTLDKQKTIQKTDKR
jgi:hypothetical protein